MVISVLEIDEQVLDEFQSWFLARNIPALSTLAAQFSSNVLRQIEPSTKNAARLAGRLAVLADLGCISNAALQEFLLKFPTEIQGSLRGSDTVCVRFAFGVCEFLSGDNDLAMNDFDYVLNANYEKDTTARILALFFKGRCLCAQGQLQTGLSAVQKARDLAEKHGQHQMAAAIKVKEGRLQYQLGNRVDAENLYDEAWRDLKHSADYVSRGNIRGFQGKMHRRLAHYQIACKLLTEAVGIWRKNNRSHRNMARDLAQLAIVKILEARRLEAKLDREHGKHAREREFARHVREATQRLRELNSSDISPASAAKLERALAEVVTKELKETRDKQMESDLSQIDRLREQARAHLNEAEAIYGDPLNPRGLACALSYEAMLDMDRGEYDAADTKLQEAYESVEKRIDNVALARVSLVWSALFRVQGKGIDSWSKSNEAWERAEKTQNPRLKGRAAVALGNCEKDQGNTEGAKQWRDRAITFLGRDGSRDYAWDDLVQLNGALFSSASIEETAAALLQNALLGQMPLETINDRFEENIVMAVYDANGQKISTTAEVLVTGPTKVQRIVRRR
jgi:tetratricopeptide (TPR) repeat protein